MAQFELDSSKAQTLQISNDTFFFITEEEEPLDEANLEEAQEILDMFPKGFYVEDNWKYVENSDLIEATFIPYVESTDDYDEYEDITKYVQIQIKWIDANHVKTWLYNSQKGTKKLLGEFEVYTNEYGHKCFKIGETLGKTNLFFIKYFSKRIAM